MSRSPQTLTVDERRTLASWAADCAEHVLAIIEDAAPHDGRVRAAIDNAVAAGPVETNVDQIVGVLHIGPDRTGRMLEVVTVDDVDDGEVVIHAMKLRKALRALPPEGGLIINDAKKQRTNVKVTDELAERLADDAETGYPPRNINVRPTGRGRPRLATGEGPSPTVNARLDDELADLLEQRADREGVHKSEIVREALRTYLA